MGLHTLERAEPADVRELLRGEPAMLACPT
jgi:hypothetical protein